MACESTHLGNGQERVGAELAVEERVELVLGNDTSTSKHSNTAVLQLSLAEPEIRHRIYQPERGRERGLQRSQRHIPAFFRGHQSIKGILEQSGSGI